jgi:hypothetical protein
VGSLRNYSIPSYEAHYPAPVDLPTITIATTGTSTADLVADVITSSHFPDERVQVVDCSTTPVSEGMKEVLVVFDVERSTLGEVKDWLTGNPVRPRVRYSDT